MPKASGKHDNRGNQYTSGRSSTGGTSSTSENKDVTTKEEAIKELGFKKTTIHRFEEMASNPDLVEQAKAKIPNLSPGKTPPCYD